MSAFKGVVASTDHFDSTFQAADNINGVAIAIRRASVYWHQRNLMTFIASSVFASLCVCTASSKSPREIANDKRTTFNAEISNAVSRDMVSKVPADDDLNPPKQDHPSYLAAYAYAEVPPDAKPADTVRDSLKDIPIGTPVEEIKRASDAFGLDFSFMKAVAKIESDFDPKQRTGSYFGLFQLSKGEFAKYGSGDILDARDNAVAAAYKFATATTLFELTTHKKPTFSDLYLIHQQGTQGAEEHVKHPDRIAWQSMCATDEGKQKGENWCKRAIWENTLPEVKRVWKSVENLTSGIFLNMWQNQVDHFYARYSGATKPEASNSGPARSRIAKLFANDQLETPRTAVSIKEEPTPNEGQPAHRGTVNSRDLVASLKPASGFRMVPSWCRGLNHPNPSVCGPVHLISQVTDLPKDLKPKSHVHLVRTSSR
jgi:hypothetical protein